MQKEWRGHSYALTQGASLGNGTPLNILRMLHAISVCIANAC